MGGRVNPSSKSEAFEYQAQIGWIGSGFRTVWLVLFGVGQVSLGTLPTGQFQSRLSGLGIE